LGSSVDVEPNRSPLSLLFQGTSATITKKKKKKKKKKKPAF
jgi:hypothetical protein